MNRIKLTAVMILWGSLGVFTRAIPLPALTLAFLRALIALPVLFIAMKIKKSDQPIRWTLYKPYILSGILLGFGWLTLFYGYKHTSISSAVIIYNMCPVYVMLAAPAILKERITKSQVITIFSSFLGLFLIVGNNLLAGYGFMGMLLSALSGMMYAIIVLINRSIKNRINNETATFVQVFMAMIVLLPFAVMNGNIADVIALDSKAIIYILLLGILHTGVAYLLFFSVYEHMKSVDIVTYSYLEPLFSIIFSVIFIGEALTFVQVVGGVLILGSTYIGEIIKNKTQLQSKNEDIELS
jgi:drug/metabolite transporter (DMT)-like permease